jgi:hypothetical protein
MIHDGCYVRQQGRNCNRFCLSVFLGLCWKVMSHFSPYMSISFKCIFLNILPNIPSCVYSSLYSLIFLGWSLGQSMCFVYRTSGNLCNMQHSHSFRRGLCELWRTMKMEMNHLRRKPNLVNLFFQDARRNST